MPGPTPEITATMADLLARGEPIDAACSRAGIGKTTHYRWRGAGERALMLATSPEVQNPGVDDVPAADRAFVAYVQKLDEARGRAVAEAQATLTALANGIEKTKTVHSVGACQKCTASFETTTTTTETVIDPASTRWLLERLDRAHYHLSTKVEVEHKTSPGEEVSERLGPLVTTLFRSFVDQFTDIGGEQIREAAPDVWRTAWEYMIETHAHEIEGGPQAIEAGHTRAHL